MQGFEIRQVSKTYRQGNLLGGGKKIRAVHNVTLSIRPGSCLALVGASGSGKSTLGRLLLGLERPDSGTILYNGTSPHGLRGKARQQARRSVQAVFQNIHGSVNPRFTAREILAEPLHNFDSLSGRDLDVRIEQLLAEVGMENADLTKRPHQFSGGELQRLCLARALAPRPELIILDEALSSLDMRNQSRILAVLSRIRKTYGTAFLFITHDMRLATAAADSLAVMERGEISCQIADLDNPPEKSTGFLQELIQAVLPNEGGNADVLQC